MKKKFKSVEFNGQKIKLEFPPSDHVTMGMDFAGNKLMIMNASGNLFQYDTVNGSWKELVRQDVHLLLAGLRKLLP